LKRRRQEISISEALDLIIYNSEPSLQRQRFPQIDLMILLDVLTTLTRFEALSLKPLSNRLRSKPDPHTLRKYLGILLELKLVSVRNVSYRGVARSKHFFEISEKGREFVTSLERIQIRRSFSTGDPDQDRISETRS